MNTIRQLRLLEVLVVVAIVATIALKVIPFFTHRSAPRQPTAIDIVCGIVFAIAWLVWRIHSSRKTR
jgi:hypothetical protein